MEFKQIDLLLENPVDAARILAGLEHVSDAKSTEIQIVTSIEAAQKGMQVTVVVSEARGDFRQSISIYGLSHRDFRLSLREFSKRLGSAIFLPNPNANSISGVYVSADGASQTVTIEEYDDCGVPAYKRVRAP